jgi:hypothetical protein
MVWAGYLVLQLAKGATKPKSRGASDPKDLSPLKTKKKFDRIKATADVKRLLRIVLPGLMSKEG